MSKKQNQISLDFISDLKYTEFCVLVFGFIKKIIHIEDDDFFKIEISLREIINNAIVHGNKYDPRKRVHVKLKWTKSRVWLSIKDENREKVNFAEINKQLASKDVLAFHGRGIMIVKSYMDKVKFVPTESGLEIIMEKRL
jgi:serine/threonine-protein kinase RsbW